MLLFSCVFAFFPSAFAAAHTVWAALGVMLFSFYLVYDVQLILGGKHLRYRFQTDEYVFASLNIYLDIVNIFVRILHLLSKER